MDACKQHSSHAHHHAHGCGHHEVQHDGHKDHLHDGHLHHQHGDHVDDDGHCDDHGKLPSTK